MNETLRPGENAFVVPLPINRAGSIGVSVSLDDGPGTRVVGFVRSAPRVLVVRDATAGDLTAAALAAMLRDSARVGVTSPTSFEQLPTDDVAAVVLADVPADDLSPGAIHKLITLVRRGGGLVLAGAARSFGPGGYGDSPLAPLLPVRMPPPAERDDPSTALVLILDTSASMEGEPIDLAKEVARLAIDHLRPLDKVGLVEFYGGRRWATPLQDLGDGSVIQRALDRLTAGGGTVLFPAVEEADFALRNIQVRNKQVLLISDGFVENAPFAAIVKRMASEGVTLSTVEVGQHYQHESLMGLLAEWGRGRYYTVPDRFVVPDLTLKKPQLTPLSQLVTAPTSVFAQGPDRTLDADAIANVNGYVHVQAKPTADTLLATTDDSPLLSRWRCGAGWVATLPTQLGSTMTSDLQRSPTFERIFSGLFRTIDASAAVVLAMHAIVRPAGVELDATSGENIIPTATFTVTDAAGRVVKDAVAEPMATGRWDVLIDGLQVGTYEARARVAGLPDAVCAFVVAAPAAEPRLFADTALLDRISAFEPRAEKVAVGLPGATTWTDLRGMLAAIAVMAVLAHLYLRRREPEAV